MTAQTFKVLGILLSRPREEISGAEVARATKLASGTLYPILLRLEKAGWVESNWETGDPHKLGRPRRRFYRITAEGARGAQFAFQDIFPVGELAWR
jgi:PadR family transcriptional regulator, regulatory protein PadR